MWQVHLPQGGACSPYSSCTSSAGPSTVPLLPQPIHTAHATAPRCTPPLNPCLPLPATDIRLYWRNPYTATTPTAIPTANLVTAIPPPPPPSPPPSPSRCVTAAAGQLHCAALPMPGLVSFPLPRCTTAPSKLNCCSAQRAVPPNSTKLTKPHLGRPMMASQASLSRAGHPRGTRPSSSRHFPAQSPALLPITGPHRHRPLRRHCRRRAPRLHRHPALRPGECWCVAWTLLRACPGRTLGAAYVLAPRRSAGTAAHLFLSPLLYKWCRQSGVRQRQSS